MESIFNKTQDCHLREYLDRVGKVRPIDVQAHRELTWAALRYYRGDSSVRAQLSAGQALEARWYQSLEDGKPDYSVYDDDNFVSELWSCWIIYSRGYLRELRKGIVAAISNHVKVVADIGCGIGYTTAGLKELFPSADVYGTNIRDTWQWAEGELLGDEYGFTINGVVDRQTDLIFASEFFEHFDEPIDLLGEIIECGDPKYLVIANSFGSRSIGHFNAYKADGQLISNKAIGRVFNKALRCRGYQKIETGFWNGRPAIWAKEKFGYAAQLQHNLDGLKSSQP